jgi:hypothetical protein
MAELATRGIYSIHINGGRGVFIEPGQLRLASPGLHIAPYEQMNWQLRRFHLSISAAKPPRDREVRVCRDAVGDRAGQAEVGRRQERQVGDVVILLLHKAAQVEAGVEPVAHGQLRSDRVIVSG